MKSQLKTLLAASIASALLAIAPHPIAAQPDNSPSATTTQQSLSWTPDLQRARYEARVNESPLVVYFYNLRARPARQMINDTLKNPEVMEELSRFTRATANETERRDLAREFKIIKVPTAIFFDPEGREIDRAVGYKTPEEFLIYLGRIQNRENAPGEGHGQMDPFSDAALDITTPGPGRQSFHVVFENKAAQSVHLVGDFNDWRTDAHPLQKGQGGLWNIDVHLREGIYEYMFLVDGSEYMQDPRNILAKPNPYGGLNSIALAGAPTMSPLIQGNKVTFMLYRPEASQIEVAGSFTNWERITMFRKQDDPAMWGVQYTLPPGRYTYKYVIDGEWTVDPENYLLEKDPDGQFNSVFVISNQAAARENRLSAQNGG